MKKIIIATDFSPAAHNAANYGAEMALAINADILLLHVYQMPVPSAEIAIVVAAEDLRIDSEEKINKLKKELEIKTGKKIYFETEVRMGSFYGELKAVCKEIRPYTVILGSQGITAAERLLFGSQSVYIMRHLNWPVITVPLHSTFSAIKKIGLACDFDNVIGSIPVNEIKRLVTDFNAELHVLNTGRKTEFNPDVVFESGMLQGMIRKLNPQYHFITNGNTDDGILEFAEKNNLDLLLVLPKSHNLVEKLFHKSHTKQFVLHSHIPVMALHL